MLRCKSFYLNQNQVFKVNSVSGVVLDIKKQQINSEEKKIKNENEGCSCGHH